jgi:hypothetical protein
VVYVGTTRLIFWIVLALALSIAVVLTSLAYIETLYIRSQLKQEIKELRQLKRQLKEKADE